MCVVSVFTVLEIKTEALLHKLKLLLKVQLDRVQLSCHISLSDFFFFNIYLKGKELPFASSLPKLLVAGTEPDHSWKLVTQCRSSVKWQGPNFLCPLQPPRACVCISRQLDWEQRRWSLNQTVQDRMQTSSQLLNQTLVPEYYLYCLILLSYS